MSNDLPTTIGETVPAVKSSLGGRLANIFITPGEVFAEVKAAPVSHTNWLVPALIFVLASWCAAALMFTQPAIKQQVANMQEEAMQKQFQKQIDSGKMTQAQVDQIKAGASRFSGIGQLIGGVISPLFVAGVTPFWGGFVLWAGAMFIFKRPIQFLKGVEVVGLTLVILAVGALVKGLLCTAVGSLTAIPGPILLVKQYQATNPLHNLLLMLDVFTIWAIVARGVGLAKLCDISPGKALAWVLGVWILVTGGMFTLSWAAQQAAGMLSGQR